MSRILPVYICMLSVTFALAATADRPALAQNQAAAQPRQSSSTAQNRPGQPQTPPAATTPAAFRDEIARWQKGKGTLLVTIESDACEKACPEYSLTITSPDRSASGRAPAGAGAVTFMGSNNVLVIGNHSVALTRAQRDKLAETLDPTAAASAGSGQANPEQNLQISASVDSVSLHTTKEAAASIAAGVVNVVDIARWTTGNSNTIPSLQAEHWDFHSADPTHAALLIVASGEGKLDLVQQLLQLGAPPNARSAAGGLPLFAAIEVHHTEIVQALLKAGANKQLKSPDGELPLDLANELGYNDIAALLK